MRSPVFENDSRNRTAGTPAPDSGEHRFSDSYRQRRQALIAAYGRQQTPARPAGRRRTAPLSWKVAAAAAAALVALPVTAWAVANNAEFFAGAFGDGARTSVQAHEEVQLYKDGKPVTVTYPSREYVEADPEAAERLLGACTATDEVPIAIGDHTLTVLSTVRDRDTMVVHYTLEHPGGVTALQWNDLTNQGKGAFQPNDGPYRWEFVGGMDEAAKAEALARWEHAAVPEDPAERDAFEKGKQAAAQDSAYFNYASSFTFVDPQRSTADKLYCYEYLVFTDPPADGAPITLTVFGSDGSEQSVEIPTRGAAPSRTLSAEGIGSLEVSPLSLRFDHTGEESIVNEDVARARYEECFAEVYGSFEEYLAGCADEMDGDAVGEVKVEYRDGTSYTLYSEADDLDNAAHTLLRSDRQTVWMFNRLVDPEAIAGITVNGVRFA